MVFAACGKPSEDPRTGARMLAGKLESDLRKVRAEVERLAASIAELYKRRDEILPAVDRSKYGFAENGSFYKLQDDGGPALWISGAVPITPEVIEDALLTEPIDPDLKRICESFPEVAQAYYNDANSQNRIYPWFDVVTQYPPKMNIPEFNFYYLADAKHNPERRGVWVNEPYVDPAGRGWMVSAIAPVYVGDTLKGVPGLDVTIDTIVSRYLGEADAPTVIVDQSGVVVAATEAAIALLGMPPLRKHKYLETVKQDTFKQDDYNLRKSPLREVREAATAFLDGNEEILELRVPTGTFNAGAAKVPELRWTVIRFSPAK